MGHNVKIVIMLDAFGRTKNDILNSMFVQSPLTEVPFCVM